MLKPDESMEYTISYNSKLHHAFDAGRLQNGFGNLAFWVNATQIENVIIGKIQFVIAQVVVHYFLQLVNARLDMLSTPLKGVAHIALTWTIFKNIGTAHIIMLANQLKNRIDGNCFIG